MDTLTSISVFRQVVESGSFVAAAERLDLSTAMVSRHVMHVEKRVGTRLLHRNPRALHLTEPGRVYFERCKSILDDLASTELELGSLNTTPSGTLRISCTSWFAGQRLADLLAVFRQRYPDITVDVSFEDRVVNLVEQGYDIALQVAENPQSLPASLIARPAGRLESYLAASPQYLRRRGVPRVPEDLARHDCIAIGDDDTVRLIGAHGPIEVPMRVVVRYRSVKGVANAVAAGIGLAALPAISFEDTVSESALIPVLTDFPVQTLTLFCVYATRKQIPMKMRAFIDFFLDWASRRAEFPVAALATAAA